VAWKSRSHDLSFFLKSIIRKSSTGSNNPEARGPRGAGSDRIFTKERFRFYSKSSVGGPPDRPAGDRKLFAETNSMLHQAICQEKSSV